MKKIIKQRFLLFSSIVILLVILFDLAFNNTKLHKTLPDTAYFLYGILFFVFEYSFIKKRNTLNTDLNKRRIVFLANIIVLIPSFLNVINIDIWIISTHRITLVFYFFVAIYVVSRKFYSLKQSILHPALVFVLSFFLLIVIGAIMLSLPRAANESIHVIDALFMSTSAVCVTGLSVYDISKEFSEFGQWILIGLIQIGALGMLTFTNLFGLFFSGKSSLRNQIILQDYISSDNLNSTKGNLLKIIGFTLFFEFLGFVLIFTHTNVGNNLNDRLFFSLFHAVSAFCNAGFSTLTDGLYNPQVQYNYSLHFIIAVLIIVGGIGYNVFINLYLYIKRFITIKFYAFFGVKNKNQITKPIISLNTKIVFYSTLFLLLTGTLGYYVFEYNNTLAAHQGIGKLTEAFFGAVTPRTAGFNTVNISALSLPTIMIYLFLMWVGASPGSTGGGIKTTTITLASMSIFQFVTGRQKLHVNWKEIPAKITLRAAVIIYLSLIVIGIATFLIFIFDPQLNPVAVTFEVFSAYSTVGLSMGITTQLSTASKIVLIFVMFIGRVSFFTILIGLVRQFFKPTYKPYQYPTEDIPIN